MILVDSSVWIDYLKGNRTAQVDKLDALLGAELVVIGDLILTEVLQGVGTDREFRETRRFLLAFDVVTLCGPAIGAQAAANFRALRRLEVTVRKTVDTIIATWCITHRVALLHDDRDFDAFAEHLGMAVVK